MHSTFGIVVTRTQHTCATYPPRASSSRCDITALDSRPCLYLAGSLLNLHCSSMCLYGLVHNNTFYFRPIWPSIHIEMPFVSWKTELFKNTLQSGYIWKRCFHSTVSFETDDTCLVMWHIVPIYICLYWYCAFYVLFTFTLLLQVCYFVHSSYHSPS